MSLWSGSIPTVGTKSESEYRALRIFKHLFQYRQIRPNGQLNWINDEDMPVLLVCITYSIAGPAIFSIPNGKNKIAFIYHILISFFLAIPSKMVLEHRFLIGFSNN